MNTAMQAELPEFPARVEAFLEASRATGVGIDNVRTRVASVGEGDLRVPVSVNSSEPDNAWVCSPHTAYCRYSIEELERPRARKRAT